MLQILFIMCQNFNKKKRSSKSIDNFLKTFFKVDTKNLFLNFQKFEYFKNEKAFPKSCLFVSLPSDSLQFQKQLISKTETRLVFKPL